MVDEIDSPLEDDRTMAEKYRDSYRGSRQERKFVGGDDDENSVLPLDTVPEVRDGSWTNGLLAWGRGETSTDVEVVGWWVLPRKRMKNTTRKYRVKTQLSSLDGVKKDFDDKKPRISPEKRMENRAKGSIRILRSRGYSMAEALMITKGQMGLDRQLVPLVDDSEE